MKQLVQLNPDPPMQTTYVQTRATGNNTQCNNHPQRYNNHKLIPLAPANAFTVPMSCPTHCTPVGLAANCARPSAVAHPALMSGTTAPTPVTRPATFATKRASEQADRKSDATVLIVVAKPGGGCAGTTAGAMHPERDSPTAPIYNATNAGGLKRRGRGP